jgi:hypothetical protein
MIDGTGHLFVIDGDLTQLACDAILIPTDDRLSVTSAWSHFLGMHEAGVLPGYSFSNGRRAIPFAPAREIDGPRIWLGNIGAVGNSDDWYAEGLVEFVEHAGSELLANWDRVVAPRLAVNVAGSGAGGFIGRKGTLFDTIIPALQAAAHTTKVDVVLVCWGERPYSAAQLVRQRTTSQRVLPARFDEPIRALAHHTQERNLVLFLGAGISSGAGIASWGDLLENLRQAVGKDRPERDAFERLGHLDRAALIEKLLGRVKFDEVLRSQIAVGTRYSLAHGLLAGLRTAENVTTNYDILFEAAVTTADRKCAVLPYDPVTNQGRWLLKLHGSVEPQDQLVLTRSDYLGLPSRSGALFGIMQAMLMTRHMLFVGYSLNDDTFHKVMHDVRQAQAKSSGPVGTALTLFADPLLSRLWKDELELVHMMDHPATEVTDDEIQIAARRLEIFLDCVALEACDVSTFFLDETYAELLDGDPDVRLLRQQVIDLLATADAISDRSAIAERVRRLLAPLRPE